MLAHKALFELDVALAGRSDDVEQALERAISAAGAYAGGTFTAADHAKAATLYKKACDADNATGCYALATFIRHGWGTKANAFEADDTLKKACDLGNATACKELHQ